MQKVVGSNPIIRSLNPLESAGFSVLLAITSAARAPRVRFESDLAGRTDARVLAAAQVTKITCSMSSTLADEFARRADELRDRVRAERPTTWRPDDPHSGHPQTVVGLLVEWDRRSSGYDDRDVDIATLRTPEGAEWSIWGYGTVLEGEFAKLRSRPGESVGQLVAVAYKGVVEKGGGARPYRSYRVVVDSARNVFAGESPAVAAQLPLPATAVCDQCGYAEPEHAANCPNSDLPPF
jgi:hypothetical protein